MEDDHKKADITEYEQYIGTWSMSDAPNEFMKNLILNAIEDGGASTMPDSDGCEVTATIQ